MSLPLSRATLRALHPSVLVPAYDPARVMPGIVHLGLGNFHRAHMARYTHALMQRDAAHLQWGIVGTGLMPGDRRMAESLAPQDALYTLVERNGTDETASVIGALAGVIFAGEECGTLLDAIDDSRVRIVSLTVTENGYCLHPVTRVLDPTHPLIGADLLAPARPRSAIGILVEAYRRRMVSGAGAFTALSCDNIQHNGDVLKQAVLALAALRDPTLAAWVEAHATFPNTMVDRITPVTSAADVAHVERTYGLIDRWPVMCEDFTQWVIEDRFCAGRPPWELDGAQFVPDVAPYEMMKLRLLNASHLAIAAIGRLIGYRYIHEAMEDARLRGYMAALMDRETGPTLPDVPGIDLALYKRTLIARFANPAILDTVERVNTDAPLNMLVVPLRARLEMGGGVDLLALGLAAWMRRALGTDEAGEAIEVRHPMAALLQARAAEGRGDPAPLLAIEPLFGTLAEDARLVGPLRRWLESLYAVGSRATLERAAAEMGFWHRSPAGDDC